MSKQLISLEVHNAARSASYKFDNSPEPNGIECPQCGHELVDSNPMVVLTSMPAQKNVHCLTCRYRGYRYL